MSGYHHPTHYLYNGPFPHHGSPPLYPTISPHQHWNYQSYFHEQRTHDPIMIPQQVQCAHPSLASGCPPVQHNARQNSKMDHPNNYFSYHTPFEESCFQNNAAHPERIEPYRPCNVAEQQTTQTFSSPNYPSTVPSRPPFPPNPCPVYMSEIFELARLDVAYRDRVIEQVEMLCYHEPLLGSLECRENYTDLVKRLLLSAKLGVFKSFAVVGFTMTENTFNRTLKEYMNKLEYRKTDLLDFLIRKWYSLSKDCHKDNVEEYNQNNLILALRRINVIVQSEVEGYTIGMYRQY